MLLKKIAKNTYFKARRTIFKRLMHIKISCCKSSHFGENVFIGNYVRVYYNKGKKFQIGDNSKICNYSKIIFIGEGGLHIGDNCCLGEYNRINVGGNVRIGNSVITADNVSFITTTHEYKDISLPIRTQKEGCGDITIGDGSWIALNAVILEGSSLGKNTVVAANSVVKGEFPDYCVLAGAPAKIVRIYDEKSGKYVRMT